MNRRRLGTRIASLWATVVVFAPNAAWACAVCFSGRTEETRTAFGISTAGMTALPLVMLAGFVWWIRRRARELDDANSAQGAAAPVHVRS